VYTPVVQWCCTVCWVEDVVYSGRLGGLYSPRLPRKEPVVYPGHLRVLYSLQPVCRYSSQPFFPPRLWILFNCLSVTTWCIPRSISFCCCNLYPSSTTNRTTSFLRQCISNNFCISHSPCGPGCCTIQHGTCILSSICTTSCYLTRKSIIKTPGNWSASYNYPNKYPYFIICFQSNRKFMPNRRFMVTMMCGYKLISLL